MTKKEIKQNKLLGIEEKIKQLTNERDKLKKEIELYDMEQIHNLVKKQNLTFEQLEKLFAPVSNAENKITNQNKETENEKINK